MNGQICVPIYWLWMMGCCLGGLVFSRWSAGMMRGINEPTSFQDAISVTALVLMVAVTAYAFA